MTRHIVEKKLTVGGQVLCGRTSRSVGRQSVRWAERMASQQEIYSCAGRWSFKVRGPGRWQGVTMGDWQQVPLLSWGNGLLMSGFL